MTYQKSFLENVSENITDGTHSTIKDDPSGECFLLSCKNIKNGRVNIGDSERKINYSQLESLKKRTQLNKHDILITTVGTIGEMAMVEDDNPNYDFQRSVGIIKPNVEKVIPEYMYYALMNELPQINSLVKGAVQQCLFLGDIKKIELQIPPRNIQERIVGILKRLDGKIRINEQINENLAA